MSAYPVLLGAKTSQGEAAAAASAVATPASSPETVQPDTLYMLVWLQEDLDDRRESGEGHLSQRADFGRVSELFFVGEIEP